jgi:hypothetical protein
MDLGDNLLKNGVKAITKMTLDGKTDCIISLMPVAEQRTKQETGPAVRDRSRPPVRSMSLVTLLRTVDSLKWWNTDYTQLVPT